MMIHSSSVARSQSYGIPLSPEQHFSSSVPDCESVQNITGETLRQLLKDYPEQVLLLDVRNPSERAVCHLPNSPLMPFPEFQSGDGLAQVQAWLADWSATHPGLSYCLVVYCAAGVRSAKVLKLLEAVGIQGLNLDGGMIAWEAEVTTMAVAPAASTDAVATETYLMKSNLWARLRLYKRQAAIASLVLMSGFVGLGCYKVYQDPDRLRPLIQAGVPVHWAENLPFLGDSVLAAEQPQVLAKELQQLLDRTPSDIFLLDVRTPKEFADTRIPGAVNIPVTDIQSGQGIEAVRSQMAGKKLIVYCAAGHRSGLALAALHRAGVLGTQLKGGISTWQREAQPTQPRP